MTTDYTNPDNYQVDSTGGVSFIPSGLTIGAAAKAKQEPQPDENSGVNRGTFTHDTRTGQSTQQGVTSAYAGSDRETGSILSTYRSAFGSASNDYQADGTVDIGGGMRTSVEVALQMGFINKGPGGTFVDAFEGTPTAADINERVLGKAEEARAFDLFEPRHEAQFVEMLAPYTQEFTDHAHAVAAIHAADGLDVDTIAETVSQQLSRDEGGDPKFHRANVQQAMGFYQNQVANTLDGIGLPHGSHELLWDFARSTEQGRDELKQALTQLTFARSTAGFKSLAERFLLQASPSVKYLKAAGLKTRNLAGRGLEVETDNGWTPAGELRYERTKR